jgi:hypothetical protein
MNWLKALLMMECVTAMIYVNSAGKRRLQGKLSSNGFNGSNDWSVFQMIFVWLLFLLLTRVMLSNEKFRNVNRRVNRRVTRKYKK